MPIEPTDPIITDPVTPVEPIAPTEPVESDGSEFVPGSVNSAKTKKIGLGRKIINWIGRHWLLAGVVVTAATLAIGAVAGPLAPAAIAVAKFASFNLATFATIGAAAIGVKYVTFRKRRQANSAQAHFLNREKKVQKRIKKSEKLLAQLASYQKQAAELKDTLKKPDLTKAQRNQITKQVKNIYNKMAEVDKKNLTIIKGLNHEFDEVKMPGALNIPSKIVHTVKRVTGTATLSRLKAEMDPFIDKQIAKKPDSKKAEKLQEMKLDGNIVDEFFNYQIIKRKTQEELRKRAELVAATEPKGINSAVYRRIDNHLKNLHQMSYTTQQQAGPVPLDQQKVIGKTVKQIVTDNPEITAEMHGVENDKVIEYGVDAKTGKPVVVVSTPTRRTEYDSKFPPKTR